MARPVLNSMILMLSKSEKGRIEIGESGGSSFRAKIMTVVVKKDRFWNLKDMNPFLIMEYQTSHFTSVGLVFSSTKNVNCITHNTVFLKG